LGVGSLGGGGVTVATAEYPVRVGGGYAAERLRVTGSMDVGVEVSPSDRGWEIVATLGALRRDVSHALFADRLALRLLTPYQALRGGDALDQLRSQYLRKIVRRVADSMVEVYELAALNLRVHPFYFVARWIKPKMAVNHGLSRLFWWLGGDGEGATELRERVLERLRGDLDAMSDEEGLVLRDGDLYMLNPARVAQRRLGGSKRLFKLPINPQVIRVIREPRAAVGALRLILAEAQSGEQAGLTGLEPEDWAFLRTARGLQRVSRDEPLVEALRRHLGLVGAEAVVERRGSLLNSTFLIKFYVGGELAESLFAKRYFSWTDVKWVAAKLWAMPLRNFYLSPATRMSNEVYFLGCLADRGIRVPEVVYLSLPEKVLVENAIDGFSLTEAWTRMRGVLGEELAVMAAEAAGEALSRVHDEGVVLGDCKPDNFMVSGGHSPEVWVVDLEQASFKGDMAWDLAELILYMGHYLDLEDAERYASLITRGYLSGGRVEVVEGALDGRFQLAMLPWTPIWTQARMIRAVERELRK